MNFQNIFLSIIVPAYNEENKIQMVLEKLDQVNFHEQVKNKEVILVDDYSSDNTLNRAKTYTPQNYELKIIGQLKNSGKGRAVRDAINTSAGNVILVQDADMELIPEDIPEMIEQMIKLNVECINGSRYMPGIIRPLYSYKRYYFNKIFTKLASMLINVRLTDLACGYKLFSRNIYDQIKLKENRFGFEAELLIKIALLKKTLIAEVPVHYFPRNTGEGKKIRNIDGLKIFWVIIKYGLLRIK